MAQSLKLSSHLELFNLGRRRLLRLEKEKTLTSQLLANVVRYQFKINPQGKKNKAMQNKYNGYWTSIVTPITFLGNQEHL